MSLPKLTIGNLTLDVPIIQGGMGVGVSKASLAGAVSAEGALGVIASVGLGEEGSQEGSYDKRSCEALRTEIRAVKSRGLPVGVNIMVALTNYAKLAAVCVEEDVDVIISGAGLPLHLPAYVKGGKVNLVCIVSSGRAAALLCRTWKRKYDRYPDGIVVEGPMAGGHLGFSFDALANNSTQSLDELISEVLEAIKPFGATIPVIGAGGVFSGADIARLLALGASGVQMGTRFVATHECDASLAYKQAFLDATEDDIAIIQSPVGMPARVIRNDFVKGTQSGCRSQFACRYRCLLSCDAGTANYCIANVLLQAARGDFKDGFAMCGMNAARVQGIVSVKELIDELVAEAEAAQSGSAPDA